MDELKRRQKTRRILYSIPSIILLIAVVFLLARGAVRMVGKQMESAELAREYEARAEALEVRERELRESVGRLRTEEGIEDEIRSRFSVTQEGEYVAVIMEDRQATATEEEESAPWYKRFWSAIIGDR